MAFSAIAGRSLVGRSQIAAGATVERARGDAASIAEDLVY
jgi:hypothetical protein